MTVQSQIPVGTSDAIHNAFLLGWSILELKSRIQIAACNPEQITISSKETSLSNSIDALIKGTILADLQTISNMTDLPTSSLKSTTDTPQATSLLKALPAELRDQEWLTNILRALFNEELMRVTRAAFGPIGAYIEAQLHPSTRSSSTQ